MHSLSLNSEVGFGQTEFPETMSLKNRALYQGTALAVPIRQHFLGFSPWFSSPGTHPLDPLEKAGAKALHVFPLAARLKPCPDTMRPTLEFRLSWPGGSED
jgi:hypothetical protein